MHLNALHLLAARVVVALFGRATWLGGRSLVFLTVAGQRRTCTGFAFKPSHPGGKAPEKQMFICLKLYARRTAKSRKKTSQIWEVFGNLFRAFLCSRFFSGCFFCACLGGRLFSRCALCCARSDRFHAKLFSCRLKQALRHDHA